MFRICIDDSLSHKIVNARRWASQLYTFFNYRSTLTAKLDTKAKHTCLNYAIWSYRTTPMAN